LRGRIAYKFNIDRIYSKSQIVWKGVDSNGMFIPEGAFLFCPSACGKQQVREMIYSPWYWWRWIYKYRSSWFKF